MMEPTKAELLGWHKVERGDTEAWVSVSFDGMVFEGFIEAKEGGRRMMKKPVFYYRNPLLLIPVLAFLVIIWAATIILYAPILFARLLFLTGKAWMVKNGEGQEYLARKHNELVKTELFMKATR